ncbi:MAG: 2-oxoacid:acceptor oxidoreductase family protein [Candidatus Diapherotrites archaeon]|uniref:pyruvate synthase n=1 Tax=Candidatus Iainarchaeum sp. TaxID=3101447 RepID=A0A8T4L8M9_9ARCH|nr:2-oxoacid:acceptor oxidoreductase family protein [Candidatus Diapherotrites archaeon]
MIEIRFHGRAGQGIVTAADLLAQAAAMEGKFTQSMPVFGSEKRGPPVASFCRIDDKPIHLREEIRHPDIVVVAEPSVMEEVKVEGGLKNNGLIIVNSVRTANQLGLHAKKIIVFNGTSLAVKHLGKPITNTVMLGTLIKITGLVKLASIHKAVQQKFPPALAEQNIKIIDEAYNAVERS